ncbi:MAG: Peptidase, M23/M37 family [Parcubacteria group bacterium GW2011_GWA2_43_17]|nr:MAG: Peptidase, M23/M37 family [Parcubacteria group bacterium GW2011_GWA2_43_17]KKT94501.1 MAG: Peptidase, M23/M37 family [Parcubacteria group bacterium GW2011_GWF2_45_11]KKT98127.1 MAG: Peptidase, M23/M37 family [Parcubacteria group bacterium GW2011_GWC2_45_15]OGY92322.1 MAG: hypothetical protein A2260_00820 [Candidatus Komeilibacteria bacterium RIFOXYA2_FULL_45_9]OGY95008.1 MAG: hypothetical protein A3J95_03760 [Candidatus Komeilibacteria bacterium RIFOXYC2_FULL_45_12]HAH04493.1 hypotheti
MKKRSFLTILIFLTIGLCLAPLNLSLAQDNLGVASLTEELDPAIQELKDEISKYQSQVEKLKKQQNSYEASLKIKHQQINNLKNQLGILDDSIAKLILEIQTTQLQIEQTNLEIQNLNLQIERQVIEIQNYQAKMAGVLRTIDKKDRKKSHLEALVLQGTLGSFFEELNQLQSLENTLNKGLNDLTQLKNELEGKKSSLETRKDQLNNLKDKLLSQSESLEGDRNVKDNLLDQTRGEEGKFQQLLEQLKAEQSEIESSIQNLEVEARRRILETEGILPSDAGFIWPVPSRKITTNFHDPDYPFRYIFEHPAIDIGSTPQGTAVRAARSGYVARVKYDGNSNYAYILLVHNGGLSTVYGHISKPYVTEDSFVVQGEVIALSGGMPGTTGAGRLTTGPHLHFEVRLNGIPVNPLQYLP